MDHHMARIVPRLIGISRLICRYALLHRRIAISVYDAKTLEGYQIRGTAEHVADGPVVAKFKVMVEQMFQGAATAKGALIITPETVVVTMPGAENKKVL